METRETLETFLSGKLAEAEEHARVRDGMADGCRVRLTKAEWREAMNLHPSTRGQPMPTVEEQERDAAIQRRIAARYRREADLYRTLLARLRAAELVAAKVDDLRERAERLFETHGGQSEALATDAYFLMDGLQRLATDLTAYRAETGEGG